MADHERGAEFGGLGAADLLGATPQSWAELAKFRLMYSPGMYANAATTGMRWPGALLVGGRVAGGLSRGMAGAIPGQNMFARGARNTIGGFGSFLGGGEVFGGFLSQAQSADLNEAYKSGKLFTKRGFGDASRRVGYQGIRQSYRDAEYLYTANARMANAPYDKVKGFYTSSSGKGLVKSRIMAVEASGFTVKPQRLQTVRQSVPFWKSGGFKTASYMGLRTMSTLSTLMTVGLAFEAGTMIGYGSIVGATALARKMNDTNYLDFGGGQFMAAHSQPATTERRRAMQAIQSHHLNARRFIGNEANLMHM